MEKDKLKQAVCLLSKAYNCNAGNLMSGGSWLNSNNNVPPSSPASSI